MIEADKAKDNRKGNDVNDIDYTMDMDTENEFDLESLTEEEEKELIKNIKHPDKSNTYVKKEEQYKDLVSSAYSFIIIAVLGIVFTTLNVLGIINFFNNMLSYIVMSALFIAFLYIGVSSYIKSRTVKGQISEENQLTDKINEWMTKNITAEQLDSFVHANDSEEIQFMNKLEKMKELITATFGELDELYLDRLVEEFYNNNFESKAL